MLLSGVGVGLTLPTYLGTAAASLPPESFATGSAVINMLRQIGLAVGVAVLVAILGSSSIPSEQLAAFQNGWTVIAAIALLSAVTGAAALPKRQVAGKREAVVPREAVAQVP